MPKNVREVAIVPAVITRDEVQRLIRDEQAQLLEVLAREEFDDEHIAGAINIPLKELDAGSAAQLDRDRPVITYCHNYT